MCWWNRWSSWTKTSVLCSFSKIAPCENWMTIARDEQWHREREGNVYRTFLPTYAKCKSTVKEKVSFTASLSDAHSTREKLFERLKKVINLILSRFWKICAIRAFLQQFAKLQGNSIHTFVIEISSIFLFFFATPLTGRCRWSYGSRAHHLEGTISALILVDIHIHTHWYAHCCCVIFGNFDARLQRNGYFTEHWNNKHDPFLKEVYNFDGV